MNRIIEAAVATVAKVVGWLEVQRNRRALYSAAVLVLPVLTGAAIISDGSAQKILAVLALLAGASVPGLARKHTPRLGRH